jgi:hypothetical protein
MAIVPGPARYDGAGHAWAATPARSTSPGTARLMARPDGGSVSQPAIAVGPLRPLGLRAVGPAH